MPPCWELESEKTKAPPHQSIQPAHPLLASKENVREPSATGPVPKKDAAFLKLDHAAWNGLEQLCNLLQTCAGSLLWQLCGVCDGCRVCGAIYAHNVYSAQDLLAQVYSIRMLPLGTKVMLRNLRLQQPPQSHKTSGELGAVVSDGATREQAVGTARLRIRQPLAGSSAHKLPSADGCAPAFSAATKTASCEATPGPNPPPPPLPPPAGPALFLPPSRSKGL